MSPTYYEEAMSILLKNEGTCGEKSRHLSRQQALKARSVSDTSLTLQLNAATRGSPGKITEKSLRHPQNYENN